MLSLSKALYEMGDIEINTPLVQNIGNISRESCISSKQKSVNARVHLHYLQVIREIFPIFETKGRLIYILQLLNWPFWAFLLSPNDIIWY